MTFLHSSRRCSPAPVRRLSNRDLAIAAVLLWAMVAGLTVLYLRHRPDVPASGVAPSAEVAVVATTFPAASTAVGLPSSTATQLTKPPTTSSSTGSSLATTTTQPRELLVAAGGDVLGDRKVGDFIDHYGGGAVFAKIQPFLASAQLAFVNLEGPISDQGQRAAWKEYTFRARPALVDGLLQAGIDVVSLANNHALDYGPAALLDTIARLDRAGISHAGAGADATQASAPALLTTPAGTVSVLAFTDIIPGGFAATAKTPGVNVTTPDRKRLLEAVRAAAAKTDFVIVSFHWGTEYDPSADQNQRELAHRVIDAGADLIIGHHPHVIQGLELYRDRLIAYSLGDFVWDHWSRETGETFVLRVTLARSALPVIEVVPVYLDEVTGVPAPISGEGAARILGRLARLSADLGLNLTVAEDRAWFRP